MPDANIIKTFATLLAAVGCLGVILVIIKKLNARSKGINNSVALKIISRIPLHSKSNLYIIKAGEKTLLIGATDQNVSTLADLTEENAFVQIEGKKFSLKKGGGSSGGSARKNPVDEAYEALSFRNFLKSGLGKKN